ncbi:MAG: sulfotransferase family protein [Panacagrimonas sp.]
MALQIIGAGFGRTGTMSLYAALNQLGFPCYHMMEVLENKANKSHLDFWLEVARSRPGARHDWERVFARYTAAVDNPACVVWRDLTAAYPDAKVVLSLHPKGAETWYESTMQTIYFTEIAWQFKVLEAVTPFGRKFGEMCRKLIWGRGHRGTITDRDKAIAYYHQHIDTLRKEVPADRLLVFTVTEGWGPLCEFLGVPVPSTPFPNVNDRPAFEKIKAGINRGAYMILGLGAIVVAIAAYGIARVLG